MWIRVNFILYEMVKSKNRSKGNTRPSNSGHSAELLVSTGLQPLFSGFCRLQIDANGMMASVEDQDIIKEDDALNAILKKLLKRDSTTKLKAMVELLEYCQDCSHDIKCLLPLWPRFFNRLAVDTNKRVRELIHKANEILISKAKQDCLPYLKTFMGTWLITQCDPHSPAASNAQNAFASVFPKSKQADALMFCQAEILKAITDGLFVTEESFPEDPNILLQSERSEKYRLVVTCCISGIQKFISYLSVDNRSKVQDSITSIVSNPLFWNYAHHGYPEIRAQWFLLVSSLCVDMPLVFEKLKVELVRTVMGCLADRDPCAFINIWDCVLQVIKSFPNCWDLVDFRKYVFPVLINILEPDMEINDKIYPYLLPFISSIPEDDFIKDIRMVDKFFTTLRESILSDQYKMEELRNSLLKAFLECIVCIVDRCTSHGIINITVIKHLAGDQLMPVIETAVQPYKGTTISNELYPLLGNILLTFEAQALDAQKRTELTQYGHFLSVFWGFMSVLIKHVLERPHGEHNSSGAILSLRGFFSCLHSRLKNIKSKVLNQLSEDFLEDSLFDIVNTVVSPDSHPYTDTSASSEGCSFLKEHTIKTCEHLFKILNAEVYPCCLEFLSELIIAVNSPQVYVELLHLLNIPVVETNAAPEQFFEKFIIPQSEVLACNWQLCNSMLNILFCICSCLKTERALLVLDACAKAPKTDVLFCQVVRSALCGSKGHNDLFNLWFKTPVFSQTLRRVTMELIAKLSSIISVPWHEDRLRALTVKDCVSEACCSGRRIPVEEGHSILELCAASVCDSLYLNTVKHEMKFYDLLKFISDVCQCLYKLPLERRNVTSLEEILFQLFMISVNRDEYCLPVKRADEIKNEWKSGMSWCAQLGYDESDNFITRVADYIHNLLQEPMETGRFSYIKELASEFLQQVDIAYKSKIVKPFGLMHVHVTGKVFPTDFEWKQLRKSLKLDFVPSVLQGNFFYPILGEHSKSSCPESAPQVIVTASGVAFLFKKLLVSDDPQRSHIPPEICAGPLTGLFLKNIPHLIWASCYVKSKGYFRNEVVKCNPSPHELETFLKALTPFLKYEGYYERVLSSMSELSFSDAETWALPLAALLKLEAGSRAAPECLPEMVNEMQGHSGLNKICTMQVCCELLPQNEKVNFIKGIPDDFFKAKASHASELEYFGKWAELNGCLTESSIFNSQAVSKKLMCFFADLAKTQRNKSETDVLYATNLFGMLHTILRDHPDMLKPEIWLYVFDIIKFWFRHCVSAGAAAVQNASLMILLSHTCTLISIVSYRIGKKRQLEEVEEYYTATAYLMWHGLLDNIISKDLLKLYLDIGEVVNNLPRLSESVEGLMYSISHSLDFLPGRQMLLTLLPDHVAVSEDPVEATREVYSMLHRFIPFLTSKSSLLQLGAHVILKKLMPLIPELCEPRNKNASDSEAEAKDYFQSFPLVPVIKKCGKLTAGIVEEVPIGSRCVVEPYTSSFVFISAYLFAWLEVLEYFKALPIEERSMFGSGMEDSKLLPILLENLIRLLPESPALCSGHIKPVSIVRRHGHPFIYVEPPPASSYDLISSNHLQHWACYVYFTVLQTVPTMVRRWFKNVEKKVGEYVESFTTRTVSGCLSTMEIDAVTAARGRFENMLVHTRPQQVLAQYRLDDTSTELKITVPKNYPLGPIVAEAERTMGVSQAQLRYWLFQLNTALNYHNSSITDALARWKRNLDRKFDGIECCMICFCVFESSTSKIPGKTCSTCKKKFHDTCLYRWFSTSNTSSCPLCRNFF